MTALWFGIGFVATFGIGLVAGIFILLIGMMLATRETQRSGRP